MGAAFFIFPWEQALPALIIPKETGMAKSITTDDFLKLVQSGDWISCSIAAGQPRTLINSLADYSGGGKINLLTGLLAFPYPALTKEFLHTVSGFYGPLERMLNEGKFNLSYQPLPFRGFEVFVRNKKPRITMSTLSSSDGDGFHSFGIGAEAAYVPFLEASRDPARVTVAEVNANMPVIHGIPELGNNRIHEKEIDYFVESDQSLLEVPEIPITEVENRIAQNVVGLLRNGDTLQFGIGGIPNEVARLLSETDLKDFGVHSELISDGFLTLMEAGKITNAQKPLHPGKTLFSFALGGKALYEFLDERNGHNQGRVVAAPVTYTNDPSRIAKLPNFVSINSGFMMDLCGQVCSEAIGERQYSGVGGQLEFAEGAFYSPGGRGIMCIKSSFEKDGKRYSNIVDHLPRGSVISTPRHFVQWVVTEYGKVNLFSLTDEERPWALIEVAHPDFREELTRAARDRDARFYFNRS